MALEDFTTYDEVDPNNHIGLVGTNHIDFDAYRNEDAYLYKYRGVDHFGDFTHKIDIRPISKNADWTHGNIDLLSNEVDDEYALLTGGKTCIMAGLTNSGTNIYLCLWEDYAGTCYQDYYYPAAFGTWYYLLVKKVGTSFKLGIYSTAALRNAGNATDGDLDNLTLTLHGDWKFRYIFPVNSYNSASTQHIDIDIENLDLQEAVVGRSYGYIIG